MMKIYIAGAITGHNIDKVRLIFEKAERLLIHDNPGCQVINPLNLPHQHDKTWRAYVDECLEAVKLCNVMYVQPGWSQSEGVKIEIKLASDLQMPIVFGAASLNSCKIAISRLADM